MQHQCNLDAFLKFLSFPSWIWQSLLAPYESPLRWFNAVTCGYSYLVDSFLNRLLHKKPEKIYKSLNLGSVVITCGHKWPCSARFCEPDQWLAAPGLGSATAPSTELIWSRSLLVTKCIFLGWNFLLPTEHVMLQRGWDHLHLDWSA